MIIDVCYKNKCERFSVLQDALLFSTVIPYDFSIWIYGDLFLTYTEDLKNGDCVTVLH